MEDIACGCGSKTRGHVPPQPTVVTCPTTFPLVCAALCPLFSSGLGPALSPHPKQVSPGRQRSFPQLLPFLILHLLLKPLSSSLPSIPDMIQMERPRLPAITATQLPTQEEKNHHRLQDAEDQDRSQARATPEPLTAGTGAGKRCQPSPCDHPPLGVRGRSHQPLLKAICELSLSALHPAAC